MSNNRIGILFVILIVALSLLHPVAVANDLAEDFRSPPPTTKPRCYWYWMDGHITKAGITKDLEAMRRIGIGEGYIGIISGQSGMPASGGPEALSDAWWSFIEHAIREGGRLGVDIGFFNSPGWSQSGGPWVKPDQAMRYVVLPETRITGPQDFSGKLPAPEGPFQDIAVLAFRAPHGEDALAKESERTPTSVSFEMPAPFTARSLSVHPIKAVTVSAELEASEDGRTYTSLKKFAIDRHNLQVNVGPVPLAPIVVTFPETSARFFRLTFSAPCELGEIALSSAARIDSFAEKSLIKMFQDPLPPYDFYSWPAQAASLPAELTVDAESVVDLSAFMSADGVLDWAAPAGDWIILRAGMMPTGTKNSPSPPEATGLEVDKMNREALQAHFDAYVGHLLKRIPAAERTAWKHVVADSYEMGPQNWTNGFAAAFRARYGYDPLPWLPALTGRVVNSPEASDRFLWDLRRLVADRIATDYVGALRDCCNEHGLRMWLENYGHWGFPGEFLQYGGACDEISGEFWVSGSLGSIELRAAASAAHIYDKPVVWAEAFTGGPAFVNTPRDFKARGDWAFCEGVNQFVLHVVIHQPWEDRKPGINAPWGTEFNRHNTWFDYASPWVDYLRRCSVLLQAGAPVADIAYFIGEDTPKMTGACQPPLPPGYDFDYINAEVIESDLQVEQGCFVLPSGMRYRLLVLPESKTMRPALLKRIAALVERGGAVIGPRPDRSPSLENYPACDAEVQTIAGALWDSGKVMTGADLGKALDQLEVSPDVICSRGMLWKHRKAGKADIYFISNQQPRKRTAKLSFRVNGQTPVLWRPDTGAIETVPFEVADGRTSVALSMAPAGSVFVVFGMDTPEAQPPESALHTLTELEGPWQVAFPEQAAEFKELISWTEHPDPAIKYYSGTATYRTQFTLAESAPTAVLDLGKVDEMARVRVNGHEVATLWKPPYTVAIGEAIQPGENTIEIDVVNTWLNRLIGDAQPGVESPETFTTTKSWNAETPLQSAGLLGPVLLRAAE